MSGLINKLVDKIEGKSSKSTSSSTGSGMADSGDRSTAKSTMMGSSGTGSRGTGTYDDVGPSGATTETETVGTTGTTGTTGSVGSGVDTIDTDTNVTHDTTNLGERVHENVRHQEVEEVERQRENERHVHHVQHHVQPIVDKEVRDEVQHERTVPLTEIHERHGNEGVDREAYESLGRQHQDHVRHGEKEREVIDQGETVTEHEHHHVHNVIQPIIEKETVDRHRVHTVIPTKHVIEEAPIVHESVVHEPVSLDAFETQGGQLGSGLSHESAGQNILSEGRSERTVDGPGEQVASDLGVAR